MVVPDMEQICEIMLLSEGFDGAKVRSGPFAITPFLHPGQLHSPQEEKWTALAGLHCCVGLSE